MSRFGPEWTRDDEEWLRANYKALGSLACATHLGRSRHAIRKRANKLGIEKGRKPGKRRVLDTIKTIALYRELKSLNAVAKAMITSSALVSRTLKAAGMPVKTYSRSEEKAHEIAKDYRDGKMSVVEIGKRHGLSNDAVTERLKKMGLYDPTRYGKFANRRKPYDCWADKYGKEEADRRQRLYIESHRQGARSGRQSPRYGKPPHRGAGNGWKGWYRGHYFRSLRELSFMVEMDDKGIKWESAETKAYTVEYAFMGRSKTYRPDFVVGNVIYELKPTRLHESPNVIAKRDAAVPFFAAQGIEYRLIDWTIDSDRIEKARREGFIRFDRDYEERFLAWLKANEGLDDRPRESQHVP